MVYQFFDSKYSGAAATCPKSENLSTQYISAIKKEIIPNQLKNCTTQLLDNLKNEKYTHLLKTIFEVFL